MTSILLDNIASLNTPNGSQNRPIPNSDITNLLPSFIASQNRPISNTYMTRILPSTNSDKTTLPSVMILESNKNNNTPNTNQASNNNESSDNSDRNDDDVTGDDQYPTICLVQ